MTWTFPPCSSAVPASVACTLLARLDTTAREDAIYTHFACGNFPDFFRTPRQVLLVRGELEGCTTALPDYLGIGTNEDWVRVPMSPRLAQRVADLFGASLPTKYLVDVIWDQAQRLAPQPWGPPYDASMITVARFQMHHARIENQRSTKGASYTDGALLAGHKKDVVLTKRLIVHQGRVAIYGWHQKDGVPIQPLNAQSHSDLYADYSHGIRLVASDLIAQRQAARFSDVLASPALCGLVSDEGPSSFARYPTG